MNFLKKTLVLILIFGSFSLANTFEQNGVKEGNNRVSIGVTSIVHNDNGDDGNARIYGQYGKFLTDDVELSSYIYSSLSDGEIDYQIAIGGNYYFLKTPTLTPYIGIQYYYTDSTRDIYKKGKKVDLSSNGNNYHLGLHKFFSEEFAISPEVGIRFVDFTDYTNTYTNIYLTYFF